MDVQKLRTIGLSLIEKYPPKVLASGKLETYCNWAARDAAQAFGCQDLNGIDANEQARRLAHLSSVPAKTGWSRESGARASQHAQRGGLAFACFDYTDEAGHIALVAPEPMQPSGSWGRDVPLLYNVGKTNGLLKTSACFPVAKGEPEYYVFGETA